MKTQVADLVSISVEHSATCASQSSCATEVGVRAARGFYRTLKLDLEERIGRQVPEHHT